PSFTAGNSLWWPFEHTGRRVQHRSENVRIVLVWRQFKHHIQQSSIRQPSKSQIQPRVRECCFCFTVLQIKKFDRTLRCVKLPLFSYISDRVSVRRPHRRSQQFVSCSRDQLFLFTSATFH